MSDWSLRSKIVPDYDGAVVDALYVGGGFRTVRTQAQMLSIPFLYRTLNSKESTIVFVREEGIFYELINNPTTSTTTLSDWNITHFGTSVNSFLPVGQWDKDNDVIILQDTDAAGRNGQFYFVTDAPTPVTVTIPGLFQGQPETVSDGDLVVSVGDFWIHVQPTNTWESLNKPQSIIDYVNGIVIAHTHEMSDVTGLITALGFKYDVDDTADHTIPFNDVPDQAIIELEFLKTWYYSKTDVDTLLGLAGAGGHVIQNSGVDIPLEPRLNFTNGLTATDDPGIASVITLGGPLIQDTDIGGGDHNLRIGYGGTPLTSLSFLVGDTDEPHVDYTVTPSLVLFNMISSLDINAGFALNPNNVLMVAEDTTSGTNRVTLSLTAGVSGATFEDLRPVPTGLQYSGDYSSTFTARSLTDVGYVLGAKTYTGAQTFRAGAAGVGLAPIYFQSGVHLTVPVNGAMEYNGTHLYFTTGGTRYQIDQQSGGSGHVIKNFGTPLTARANLNFSNGITASDNTPDTDVKLGGSLIESTFINTNAELLSFTTDVGGGVLIQDPNQFVVFYSTDQLMSLQSNNAALDKKISLDFTSDGATFNATINDTRVTKIGLTYGADYSASYTARSLVDYGFVTGLTGTTGAWKLGSGGTLTAANVVLGSTVNTLKFRFPSLITSITEGAGIWLQNNTAAINGTQQISPGTLWEGQGFATGVNNSQATKYIAYVLPVQAATNPTSIWKLASAINGTSYTTVFQVNSAGDATISGKLFTTSTTVLAAINVGSFAGDPSAPVNGDLNYNSTSNSLRARINGAWVSIGSSSLSSLTAATAINTINNADFAQVWQWNTWTAAVPGLLISSNSTALAANTDGLFSVKLSGATNGVGGTYAGWFQNTRTGTSSANTAIYATASGGDFNYAIQIGAGDIVLSSTTSLLDGFGKALIKFTAVGTAVNQFTISNNSIGGTPIFSATGTDTDIGISILSKGTGAISILTGSGNNALSITPGVAYLYAANGGLAIAHSGTLTVLAGYRPSGTSAGYDMLLSAMTATATNTAGGNLYLRGGLPNGSSTTGNVGFGANGSINFQSMELGIYIQTRITAPTGNPAGGIFKWVEGGTDERWLGTDGITHSAKRAAGKPMTLRVISGSALGTGLKGYAIAPVTGVITKWFLRADPAATLTLDVWKAAGTNPTNANSITASAKPSLTAAGYATSSTLTGWTLTVTEGDLLALEIETNDNATDVELIIYIES